MKPLTSLMLTAVTIVATAASPAFAQPQADSVAALANKLSADPRERAAAGAALEKFLLEADASGRSFVAAGADRAALGLFARDFAAKADPGALAMLVVAAAPGSSAEPRLRQALSAWAGPGQIVRASEKSGAAAFLFDAQDQAKKLLGDPAFRREIDAVVSSDGATVPGGPAALERARLLRARGVGVGTGVFGPDKKAQDLLAGSNAAGALRTDAAQQAKVAGAGSGAGDFVKNAAAATTANGAGGTSAPAAQLPRSQGRPDGIAVPAPNGTAAAPVVKTPDDGRVVPKDVSAWERVKEAATSPLSDAYGFTFDGLEPAPVSFRKHPPAAAYAFNAPSGAFTKVTFYGHGAPGYMTVGEWGGDASDIANMLKGKLKAGALVDIKGCNTSSIGGGSVNPGRGISHLVRRVMYFSVPYLTGDRSETSREQLENDWDSDLARDVSIQLRGAKVCGFRTFGLVASRVPVIGTLMGNREATDSDAIGGSKGCYINGVEAK